MQVCPTGEESIGAVIIREMVHYSFRFAFNACNSGRTYRHATYTSKNVKNMYYDPWPCSSEVNL